RSLMDGRLIDPLELVMIGDITDLDGFVDAQNARLGVDFIERRFVRRLITRRHQNGCVGPVLELRSAHLFLLSELQEWWDGYMLEHPGYLGGRLLEPLRKVLKEEEC